MGIRVLEDIQNGAACFYDSSTMVAFGPVFEDLDHALAFDKWCHHQKGIRDLRIDVQRLIDLKNEFDTMIEKGNLKENYIDMQDKHYDWNTHNRPDNTGNNMDILAKVISRMPWKQ